MTHQEILNEITTLSKFISDNKEFTPMSKISELAIERLKELIIMLSDNKLNF